jgi:hypothetical protein
MKGIHIVKIIGLSVLLSIVAGAQADESKIPEPFRGDLPGSTYSISYDDIDALLGATVMVTEMSSRSKARKAESNIGTRLKANVNRLTALEGNRFYFESFDTDEKKTLLSGIRKSLESLPTDAPLQYFSKSEQLAYWLNLYNITLLDELLKIYPEQNLEDVMEGKKSILNKKLLTVSAVSLSLNDIHHNILMEKFDKDPRIIYGLYQGIVGGPNIRRQAYTSDNVYKALADNAYEFINSNRGTYADKGNVFRVSSLYERNEAYFPNFKKDLTAHLYTYLIGSMRYDLEEAKKIRTNINNWDITDLYGTARTYNNSAATNEAALLDPTGDPKLDLPSGLGGGMMVHSQDIMSGGLQNYTMEYGRFSPEQTKQLQALQAKRKILAGTVQVTDLNSEAEDNAKEEQK